MNEPNQAAQVESSRPVPLTVGFLGGGVNSAVGRAHRAAIELDGCFELVAGAFSRDAAINRNTAHEYGVPEERTHSDLETMLRAEAGRLDAVVILTPTDCHIKHVLPCLEAGVPIICEKALASSPSESQAIREAVERHNGFLAVTYNYTGYPILRELRRMIRSGQLGRIEQIHIEMPQEGFSRRDAAGSPVKPQAWRLRDGDVPTVSLDLGTHVHSIVGFLTGEHPVELISVCENFGNFKHIVTNVVCTAKYSSDLLCNIWYGKTALGYRNGLRVRVFGEKGAAEWFQQDSEYLSLADNHGRKMTLDRASPEIELASEYRYTRFKAGHPSGFIEAFANYYADVADALRAYLDGRSIDDSYVLGVDVAHEGLQMLKAMSISASSRNWVKMG